MPPCIIELARVARWRLPAKVAAVVLEDMEGQAFPPLPSLPPDVLADMSRPQPCLPVPDPDGPGGAQVIRNGLRSWRAAVGPAVPLDRAASSLRWLRAAGTSHRMLIHHFGSREGLLVEVIRAAEARQRAVLAEVAGVAHPADDPGGQDLVEHGDDLRAGKRSRQVCER
jgi:hypothetical protein